MREAAQGQLEPTLCFGLLGSRRITGFSKSCARQRVLAMSSDAADK
jgi:hypothetical protein